MNDSTNFTMDGSKPVWMILTSSVVPLLRSHRYKRISQSISRSPWNGNEMFYLGCFRQCKIRSHLNQFLFRTHSFLIDLVSLLRAYNCSKRRCFPYEYFDQPDRMQITEFSRITPSTVNFAAVTLLRPKTRTMSMTIEK